MAIELDVAGGTYNCRDSVGIELSGFLIMIITLLSNRDKNLHMQVHLRWKYSRFYCNRSGSSSPSRWIQPARYHNFKHWISLETITGSHTAAREATTCNFP
jgi:arabinogalactan endo-1,4-beta-galactosidase